MKKVITVILIFSALFNTIAQGQQSSVPLSIRLSILQDGIVDIESIFNIPAGNEKLKVSLAGDSYQTLSIRNENNEFLSWRPIENAIQIDVGESEVLYVKYLTSSTMICNSTLWEFKAKVQIPTIVILSNNIILAGIEPAPTRISVIDNMPAIIMPEGNLNITYTIGISDKREDAILSISEAQAYLDSLIDQDIKIDAASEQLTLALDAFNKEFYLQAIELARNVLTIAELIENQAIIALQKINSTETLLIEYEKNGNRRVVSKARKLLDQAKDSYSEGSYSVSENYASEAQQIIIEANTTQIGYLRVFIIISMLILVTILYLNKNTILKYFDTKQESKFDDELLKNIYMDKPHLRDDDKEIIRYILESEGVFITDIRDKFDIPKSSGWRMLRRLEDENIIETELIGRETFVKIKKKL